MTLLRSQEEKSFDQDDVAKNLELKNLLDCKSQKYGCIDIPKILGLKWSSVFKCSVSCTWTIGPSYKVLKSFIIIRSPFPFPLTFVFHDYPFITLIKLISHVHLFICVISLSRITGQFKKKVYKWMSEVYSCSTIRLQCFWEGKKKRYILKPQKFPVKERKIMHFLERKIFPSEILKNDILNCTYISVDSLPWEREYTRRNTGSLVLGLLGFDFLRVITCILVE